MIAFKTHRQAALVVLAVMLQSVFVDSSQHQKLLQMLVLASGGAFIVTAIHATFMGMCTAPWESVLLFVRIVLTLSKTFVLYVARGCTPKFPSWSLRFELLHSMARTCTETYGERMLIQKHAQWIRAQSDILGSVLGFFACRHFNRSLDAVDFNGLEHVWLRSKRPPRRGAQRLVVLYIHGGGYAIMSPRLYTLLGASLASTIETELAKLRGSHLNVDLLLGNYRKAPEYCFPTQPEDALALYEHYLLESEGLSPSQIILAGDSAGGGLVMSTLLRLRDANPEHLPLAAMLLAPAVDLTGDEPDAPDCFLSRSMCKAACIAYHPGCADPANWKDASPVHCDLRGLPPVFLQTGKLDYLFQHATRLASKAKADGATNWEVDVHDEMPHVFSIFPTFILPHAHVGVQRLAAFAAANFFKRRQPETRAARSS
jgi:acetyl esterase/lipase